MCQVGQVGNEAENYHSLGMRSTLYSESTKIENVEHKISTYRFVCNVLVGRTEG